jgi:hypothetical protein
VSHARLELLHASFALSSSVVSLPSRFGLIVVRHSVTSLAIVLVEYECVVAVK